APSQTTSQAKTPASRAPTAAPARKPRPVLPVCTVTAKPRAAATSIMPSEPRLMTPDFSLTSSPRAASISGVPAVMAAAIRGASTSMASAPPAQALVDQDIAGQQREQQDALEDAGDGAGHAQARLGQLAADVEQGHDEAGEHDTDGMQPPHEGDDDGGEAVARGNRGGELADRPHDFTGPRHARQGAGTQHAAPQRAARGKPGIARGQRRQAPHRQAIAGEQAR